MKIVMDADCLIKLTRAGLKEKVCAAFHVTIPSLVKEEVVDKGKALNLADAFVVEANIKNERLRVVKVTGGGASVGEQETVVLFQKGGYDGIGSDDKRFVRQLRLFGIPYITPAVFIAAMLRQGDMTLDEAEKSLNSLSEYISDNEYATVKMFIEQWRTQR